MSDFPTSSPDHRVGGFADGVADAAPAGRAPGFDAPALAEAAGFAPVAPQVLFQVGGAAAQDAACTLFQQQDRATGQWRLKLRLPGSAQGSILIETRPAPFDRAAVRRDAGIAQRLRAAAQRAPAKGHAPADGADDPGPLPTVANEVPWPELEGILLPRGSLAGAHVGGAPPSAPPALPSAYLPGLGAQATPSVPLEASLDEASLDQVLDESLGAAMPGLLDASDSQGSQSRDGGHDGGGNDPDPGAGSGAPPAAGPATAGLATPGPVPANAVPPASLPSSAASASGPVQPGEGAFGAADAEAARNEAVQDAALRAEASAALVTMLRAFAAAVAAPLPDAAGAQSPVLPPALPGAAGAHPPLHRFVLPQPAPREPGPPQPGLAPPPAGPAAAAAAPPGPTSGAPPPVAARPGRPPGREAAWSGSGGTGDEARAEVRRTGIGGLPPTPLQHPTGLPGPEQDVGGRPPDPSGQAPGLSVTGPGAAGQGCAEQSGTGQDGTGQDGTGQDGTGQDGTGQDGTGQDGTGQDGTGQDGTGQDGTGQDSAGQGSAGQGWGGQGQGGREHHRRGQEGAAPPAPGSASGGADGGRDGSDDGSPRRGAWGFASPSRLAPRRPTILPPGHPRAAALLRHVAALHASLLSPDGWPTEAAAARAAAHLLLDLDALARGEDAALEACVELRVNDRLPVVRYALAPPAGAVPRPPDAHACALVRLRPHLHAQAPWGPNLDEAVDLLAFIGAGSARLERSYAAEQCFTFAGPIPLLTCLEPAAEAVLGGDAAALAAALAAGTAPAESAVRLRYVPLPGQPRWCPVPINLLGPGAGRHPRLCLPPHAVAAMHGADG